VWNEIFSSRNQPELTELQQQNHDVSDLRVSDIIRRNSRKDIAGDVNAGYRDSEDPRGGEMPMRVKQNNKSMTAVGEEEVYDIIDVYDSIQYSRRG